MNINEVMNVIYKNIKSIKNEEFNKNIEKTMDYEPKRTQHREKIYDIYYSRPDENGNIINKNDLINEFFSYTDLSIESFWDDQGEYSFLTLDEMMENGNITEETKQKIEEFFQREEYSQIDFEQIATIIRVDNRSRQYDENDEQDISNIIENVLMDERQIFEYRIEAENKAKYENPNRVKKILFERLGIDDSNVELTDSEIYDLMSCVRYNQKEITDAAKFNFLAAKIAIQTMSREEVNDKVLKILYDKGYDGNIPDVEISKMYKEFCMAQEKKKEAEKAIENQDINNTIVEKDTEGKTKTDEESPNKSIVEEAHSNSRVVGQSVQNNPVKDEALEENVKNEHVEIKSEEAGKTNEHKEVSSGGVIFSKGFKEISNEQQSKKEPKKEIIEKNTKNQFDVKGQAEIIKEQEAKIEELKIKIKEQTDALVQASINNQKKDERIKMAENVVKSQKEEIESLKDRNSKQMIVIKALDKRTTSLEQIIEKQTDWIRSVIDNIKSIKDSMEKALKEAKPKGFLQKITSRFNKKTETVMREQKDGIDKLIEQSMEHGLKMAAMEPGKTKDFVEQYMRDYTHHKRDSYDLGRDDK